MCTCWSFSPASPTTGPMSASSAGGELRISVVLAPDAAPACGAARPTTTDGPSRKPSRKLVTANG